jgi:V8-like Glu-specific endopeptidase
MRRSRTAITAATVFSLLLVTMLAGPASAGDREAKARAEHARIVAYWTPERVANAKPRDFVRTANGTFKPAAKPDNPGGKPGGGGGGGDGSVVKGASWTGGGAIHDRSGKVLFEMGGSHYVCSASAVNDTRSGHSLVLTAAHCAYDEAADGLMTGFATNWMYVPDFDAFPTFTCENTKYGCWTATGLVVHSGYATAGGFNTQATVHDFAIAIMGPGGKDGTTQLDASPRGSYPISFAAMSVGTSVHAFGYPAAGKYKGRDLTYCAGPTFEDSYNGNATWGIACNMTGGSSGGPWLSEFTQAGGGTLRSLNSYGYSGLSNMYGPKFNTKTQAVYNHANTSTENFIVP